MDVPFSTNFDILYNSRELSYKNLSAYSYQLCFIYLVKCKARCKYNSNVVSHSAEICLSVCAAHANTGQKYVEKINWTF